MTTDKQLSRRDSSKTGDAMAVPFPLMRRLVKARAASESRYCGPLMRTKQLLWQGNADGRIPLFMSPDQSNEVFKVWLSQNLAASTNAGASAGSHKRPAA
jgi:hypothetical protein